MFSPKAVWSSVKLRNSHLYQPWSSPTRDRHNPTIPTFNPSLTPTASLGGGAVPCSLVSVPQPLHVAHRPSPCHCSPAPGRVRDSIGSQCISVITVGFLADTCPVPEESCQTSLTISCHPAPGTSLPCLLVTDPLFPAQRVSALGETGPESRAFCSCWAPLPGLRGTCSRDARPCR